MFRFGDQPELTLFEPTRFSIYTGPRPLEGKGMPAQPGELNRNQQRLVRKTTEPGTNHNQYVWILVCERDSAKHAGV